MKRRLFSSVLAAIGIMSISGCSTPRSGHKDDAFGYDPASQQELYDAQNRTDNAASMVSNLEAGMAKWESYIDEQQASIDSNTERLAAEEAEMEQAQPNMKNWYLQNRILPLQRDIATRKGYLLDAKVRLSATKSSLAIYQSRLEQANEDVARLKRTIRTPDVIDPNANEEAWKRIEDSRPAGARGWRCNFAGHLHRQPRECKNPQMGGRWE